MFRKVVVVAGLVGLGPSSLKGQLPEDAARRIETALQHAAAAGIPASLLESRLKEGRAKGVPLEPIAEALERWRVALARADRVLRTGTAEVNASDLTAGADALAAGVSEAVLRAISERAPQERRAVAIAALTQLVQLGHTPEQALERVTRALARGPEALANLPAQTLAARAPRLGGGSRPERVGGARGLQGRPPAALPGPGQRPGGHGKSQRGSGHT